MQTTQPVQPMRLGVLISGSGTNLQAIIDAIESGDLDASVGLVVSSRPDAFGITRAQNAGLPVLIMSKKDYEDPIAADIRIARALQEAGCTHVAMAGYMRMIRKPLLDAFPNKIINLHPALLPAFPGAHAIEEAFQAGVLTTGVTVHIANEVYDEGPIILQQEVPIYEEDSLEDLEQRIHATEHVIYPKALQLVAQGRAVLLGNGTVEIKE